MKKLLALLFIFVSLSSLKAEIQPPTENSITSEKLTRESVSVPTQKQVQDVPVHSKPAWGETIKAMYNQHPIKFSALAWSPISMFIAEALQVILVSKKDSIVPNSYRKRRAIILLILVNAFISGFSYIYLNTKVPTQGVPNNLDSEQKKVEESK